MQPPQTCSLLLETHARWEWRAVSWLDISGPRQWIRKSTLYFIAMHADPVGDEILPDMSENIGRDADLQSVIILNKRFLIFTFLMSRSAMQGDAPII